MSERLRGIEGRNIVGQPWDTIAAQADNARQAEERGDAREPLVVDARLVGGLTEAREDEGGDRDLGEEEEEQRGCGGGSAHMPSSKGHGEECGGQAVGRRCGKEGKGWCSEGRTRCCQSTPATIAQQMLGTGHGASKAARASSSGSAASERPDHSETVLPQ